jgi:quinol monooxygenase YgiN
MSVVVVATIRPQSGCRDQVIAALENAVTRVHAEDGGCELYALHENDDLLVMIEKWATPEALGAHTRSAAFAELASRLEGNLDADLDIQVLAARPSGTHEQGRL